MVPMILVLLLSPQASVTRMKVSAALAATVTGGRLQPTILPKRGSGIWATMILVSTERIGISPMVSPCGVSRIEA